ncbi:MAG: hypothetical protein JJ975_12035 [Bacteroidia bacterium]|nr:hypothetical protein [Bacteroidia bacterium]
MKTTLLYSLIIFALASCSVCGGDDDDPIVTNIKETCPTATFMNHDQLDTLQNGDFHLIGFRYDNVDQNLKLDIGINGCSFERDFNLLISNAESKSMPPQRVAKLVFEEQFCDAAFSGTICFDVSQLNKPTVLKLETRSGTQSVRIE